MCVFCLLLLLFFFFRKQGLTLLANCLPRNKSENISKCRLLIFFFFFFVFFSFDCATGMLIITEVKAIIRPVSLRELDCIPDKLSVSRQSDDRNPHTTCCTPILGS